MTKHVVLIGEDAGVEADLFRTVCGWRFSRGTYRLFDGDDEVARCCKKCFRGLVPACESSGSPSS